MCVCAACVCEGGGRVVLVWHVCVCCVCVCEGGRKVVLVRHVWVLRVCVWRWKEGGVSETCVCAACEVLVSGILPLFLWLLYEPWAQLKTSALSTLCYYHYYKHKQVQLVSTCQICIDVSYLLKAEQNITLLWGYAFRSMLQESIKMSKSNTSEFKKVIPKYSQITGN